MWRLHQEASQLQTAVGSPLARFCEQPRTGDMQTMVLYMFCVQSNTANGCVAEDLVHALAATITAAGLCCTLAASHAALVEYA